MVSWHSDWLLAIKLRSDLSDWAEFYVFHLLLDEGVGWDDLFDLKLQFDDFDDYFSQPDDICLFDLMGFRVVLLNDFEEGLVFYVECVEYEVIIFFDEFEDFLILRLIYFGGAKVEFIILFISADETVVLNHEMVVGFLVFEVLIVKKAISIGAGPCYITNL